VKDMTYLGREKAIIIKSIASCDASQIYASTPQVDGLVTVNQQREQGQLHLIASLVPQEHKFKYIRIVLNIKFLSICLIGTAMPHFHNDVQGLRLLLFLCIKPLVQCSCAVSRRNWNR
jgi:hypothetical protein